MRHYEILAAGTIPLFVDLHDAPDEVLRMFPRRMLMEARSLPGVSIVTDGAAEPTVTIDRSLFDEVAYLDLAYRLLDFTKRHLTSRSIAQYVLDTAGHSNATKVLVLSSASGEDYVRDFLVHGLKSLIQGREGGYVVDVVRAPHLYEGAFDHDHGHEHDHEHGGGGDGDGGDAAELETICQYLLVYPKRTSLYHRLHAHSNMNSVGSSTDEINGFVDMVRSLLTLDPLLRPTAGEAKAHHWLNPGE
mmetsp:Transcript_26179/g.61389  ORF Transcript_26179/g.61389 Transcript_26179/m.61389 type:complete len:246 (+) Transcript_26179:181-918(+)